MAYRIADLIIDVTKVTKPSPRTRRHCGKPATCHGCTRCTSTAFSKHKPSATIYTCGSTSLATFRKQLLRQLRALAKSKAGRPR